MHSIICLLFFFFFFNDTATTEIYTLSLHDALPISLRTPTAGRSRTRNRAPPTTESRCPSRPVACRAPASRRPCPPSATRRDRKSTRLNSSHLVISYAVFCLKKKKKKRKIQCVATRY